MKFIPRGSGILAVTTFGSYVLGLVRDRIFAQTFGAGVELDSYNAAFLVPDFAFNVLVASGIAAAAVPLFLELRHRSREEAYLYMSALLSVATLTMVVVAAIVVVGAPYFAQLVAPGVPAEGQALIIRLMRLLAWSPILFAASNTLGALLVAERRFFYYGLSPIFYNVGIIGGALFLTPRFGIMGVAYGTLLGAVLHLLMRFVDAWRLGWPYHMVWRMPRDLWQRTLRLMAPKMVGHPVELVTFAVFTSLASLLAPGSITILNFARNFQSVPVSLIGIAMATAVFPTLAEIAVSSPSRFREQVNYYSAVIGGISAVAALLLFSIRRPVVQLFLGGGQFDEVAVARTALILGFFCLAIPTEAVSHLLARAWYATQRTLFPVVLSVMSLLIASGAAYLILPKVGLVALPLGFFAGSVVKTAGLYGFLGRRTIQQLK